jgi:hypothetical protein
MQYSYIDWQSPVPYPGPSVNGGLYTGAQFPTGAAWGNIPITPNADTYTQNLTSANPPPGAMFIPSTTRPGNNEVNHFTHENAGPQYNFLCRRKQ